MSGQPDLGVGQTRDDSRLPLTDADLLALIPTMGKSQFYKRKARGEFRFLEMSPQLPDSHTLYSRALVSRWLDGVDLAPGASRPHFGRKSADVLAHRSGRTAITSRGGLD